MFRLDKTVYTKPTRTKPTRNTRRKSPGPYCRTILPGVFLLAVTLAVVATTEEAQARGFGRTYVYARPLTCWVARPMSNVSGFRLSQARREFGRPPAFRRGEAGLAEKQSMRQERVLKTIEQVKLRRLARELRLNDEQQETIREAYAKEVDRRRDLNHERTRILEKMRELALAAEPADVKKSEPEMSDLVLKYKQVEREIVEARWITQDKIFEQLTPSQKVRCILFDERFDRELRDRLGTLYQRRYNAPAPPPVDAPE